MPESFRRTVGVVFFLVTCVSCQGHPEEEAGTSGPTPTASAPPPTLPLKEIMGGLENDLSDLAHGIWIEDHGIVRDAARRIAEHPRVPPEQMRAIQASLGDEFPRFVQHDRGVHELAVALADTTETPGSTQELFAAYLQLQQGCISCHTAFRARVSEALAISDGSGG